jgi:hypothetical protein
MIWVYVCGGIVAAIALAAVALVLKSKADVAAEAKVRGASLGDWTVYYDVPGARVGLVASFGDTELLRFLVFRLHDLFDYHQGMEGEIRRIADAVRAAAHGRATESWSFVFPPAKGDCYHAYEAPDGKLFKFFDGTLFEGGISRPRFIGGDAIAKQKGLVGECVAIATHLARLPETAPKVARAIDSLVDRQLAEGRAGTGPRFWSRPNDALRGT